LAAKAKAEPGYRFYALYDKICREDLLWHAWRCCRANGGRAGVDGESLEQIEEQGVGAWLARLQEELKTKTYQPQAVRRRCRHSRLFASIGAHWRLLPPANPERRVGRCRGSV